MNSSTVKLSAEDRADLNGERGSATQWAMELVVVVAACLKAPRLVSISQAHLVGAYHSGPANLALLKKLADSGARVQVPTSLNASSADLTYKASPCYKGKDRDDARKVVKFLTRMGCRATLTCAPYFLQSPPKFGDNIAWAESNAVLFANSVIGARTLKCPQFLDLACALTGRAPYAGSMTEQGRKPRVIVNAAPLSLSWFDDRIGYQLVGYAAGIAAGAKTALIKGLRARLNAETLQGLCAAAGVSGSMAMLHIEGSTPEVDRHKNAENHCEIIDLENRELQAIAQHLRANITASPVGICIGAPHAGPDELRSISKKLDPHRGSLALPIYISIGRDAFCDARGAEMVSRLQSNGVTIVRDTCTYYGTLLENEFGAIMTNSIKWAVYASSGLPCKPFVATLDECIDAAVRGRYSANSRYWHDA